MVTMFLSLLWAWAAGHSNVSTNQKAHQAQPTPQTEPQPVRKHGPSNLPFWKWAAALMPMTVCARLGSTSVSVQTVSPGADPVSPQQTSLNLLESTAITHAPFYAKEIAVLEPSGSQVCPADTFAFRNSTNVSPMCHLYTLSISLT